LENWWICNDAIVRQPEAAGKPNSYDYRAAALISCVAAIVVVFNRKLIKI
jgi:hypothetical protein